MKKWAATGLVLAINSFAITGGPNMPEYTQFEEVSSSNLVDLNSGNFTYTIPLIEVPGPGGTYPIALGYHSGIRYNQEASWVGLGWGLNAGAINRALRGVPDDYFNSVVSTRNVANARGKTINVNIGLGNFGLAMQWDGNSGQFMGATPYLTLGLGLAGFPGVGNIGLNTTLTASGASVGIGAGLPIGTVSLGLYDTQNNSAGGNLGFNPGLAGFSISHSSGVGIGTGAGQGTTSFTTNGVTVPLGKGSLSISETRWRYTLDETIFDYMNGFLFQDGKAHLIGFEQKVNATPYLAGAGTGPRQRFERSKFGPGLFPSSDFYEISGNGITGSFQPFIEPGAPAPVIVDGGSANNEGYLIENAPSFNQITFRMDGDQGYNLIHGDFPSAEQITPGTFPTTLGGLTSRKQYGSYRILPVFGKNPSGKHNNILLGFTVRNPDGLVYEYLKPVYSHLQADYSFKDPLKSTLDRMEKINAEKYATAWLLTSVKGADYVAMNTGDPMPKAGDYGHWVLFKYSNTLVSNWSAPLTGNMPSETYTSGYYNRAYGIRDLTYLSSVETETHTATFDMVNRADVPISTNRPVSAAPTATEMKWDDGLAASNYSAATNLPAAAGGFPIQYYGGVATGTNKHLYAAATFTFPGNWGTYINKYRAAKCPTTGGQCASEKFIGFHLKYEWLHPSGTNNFMATEEYAFTGTTIFSKPVSGSADRHFNWTANCNAVSVNSAGNTEVKCDLDFYANETDARNIRIASAFINWPALEVPEGITYSQPKALAGIRLVHKGTNTLTKEIRFGYDYSLANNIPTHKGISQSVIDFGADVFISNDDALNKGKLTLKRVSVFGVGGKAAGAAVKLPDYNFTYQSGGGNPNYGNVYNLDEWGMYSPSSSSGDHRTRQDQTDQVGVCWNLTEIRLPTGGKIKLDYQRDEYYFAGMAKDTVISSGNTDFPYIAFPDIYNLDLPKITSGSNVKYDWSKFYKLGIKTDQVAVSRASMFNGTVPKTTLAGCSLPKSTTGSDGKAEDYPITTANTGAHDLNSGDMVMVVYEFREKPGDNSSFQPRLTGVANFAIVTRSDAAGVKRVKLRPLFNMDANKKFFFFPNFRITQDGQIQQTPHGEYEWSYYLVPIRNSQKKFYGGDVAVKSIKMDDGFGKLLTKNYEYAAFRKDNAGNSLDATLSHSAGATWSLPIAYVKDGLMRYWEPTAASDKLRFDPWPTFSPNTSLPVVEIPSILQDTYLTRFLDNTYQSENVQGGYFYPQAGVSYSRATEKIQDGAAIAAGYSEYQFFNLSYRFLNAASAFSASDPIAPFRLDSDAWTLNPPSLSAGLISMNGKLMKKRDISSAHKIVKSHVNNYGTKVSILDGPAAGTATKFLGAVHQKTGYKISPATTPTYLNFFVPNSMVTSEDDITDGLKVTSINTSFDAKSGVPLVGRRTNSDGSGLWTYKIPLHWSNTKARDNNQLNLISEDRTYIAYSSDDVFPRDDLGRVVKASTTRWSTVSFQKDLATRATTVFNYKIGSYEWSAPIGWSNFTVADASYSHPWRPTQDKVTLLNHFGYPIEKQNEATGLNTAEFTGYGSNLVIGTVMGSKWNACSIYTGDYDAIGSSSATVDKISGWVKNDVTKVLINTESLHFGKRSLKLLSNGNLSNTRIAIEPTMKKVTLEASARALTGAIRFEIQPANGSATVGASKFVESTSTSWSNVRFEIDLTQSQYSGANTLFVKVSANATGSGYVDDIRVFPSNAMVKTYYYDPATLKLLTVVDENKAPKYMAYDTRGRLTSIRNSAGQTVSQAVYKDFQ